MVKLTEDMIELVKAAKIYPLATASKDGEPNVVPVGMLRVMDPETLWIGNQYMKATIQNLQENPRACIYVRSAETKECLKIKGDVTILNSGADYERMKDIVKERRADLVCRSLLVMKVSAIYTCKSGPDAGAKLA